jgi:very-short-patch-repair endonuclease
MPIVAVHLMRYHDLASNLGRGRLATRLEHGDLQRITRGVYVNPCRHTAIDHADRLRALFMRLPAGTILGFHSAAAQHGFGVLPTDRVHVVVPPGVAKPRIRGVVAHETALPVRATTVLGGVPCAPVTRCVIDLARTVRRLDALPVVDAALRSGVCGVDDLWREISCHGGLPGVRQAREMVALGDARAECRQESQLRLTIIDGGLPAPEPQVWIHDQFGVARYRLDLGYRERRVGIEYDGLSHVDRDRLRHDRTRMNWLASQGWTMRYFTDLDLYRQPVGIVSALRTLLVP